MDLNNDGNKDVVTSNSVGQNVTSMLGNGDGTFQAAQSSAIGSTPGSPFTGSQAGTMGSADFNGDGFADLAITTYGGGTVLLGNGDGTFQAAKITDFGGSQCRLFTGDLNGDGKIDLAVANTAGTVSILIANGDGTFAAPVRNASGLDTQDVHIADLNHDGKMDVVSSNAISGGTITTFLGNGDGTLQAGRSYSAFSAPYRFTMGDYNGDGNVDVCVANSYTSSFVSVLYGNGDGTYGAYHGYNTGSQPWDVQSADIDGDGKLDLVEQGGASYQVELNNGDGTFTAATSISYTGLNFVADDFNKDGVADIIGAGASTIGVQINNSAVTTNVSTAVAFQVTAPATTFAGSPVPLTVSAVDANGNVVADFTGTIHITSTDTRMGGFTYNMSVTDGGTHTFANGISLYTLGSQTITVSGPALLTGSVTGTVVAAQASKFVVFADSTSVAGGPVSLTVNAVDAFGNLAAYTGTVHFSSTDMQAGLPADYTFTDADGGEHTFSAVLETSGAQTITATDTVRMTATGTSAYVSVSSAAAQSLSLVGGGGHIGSPHTVTVFARDAYGNIATGYNGSVHLSGTDANIVIGADQAAVNGVAYLTVTPMTLGTQTLTATDTTGTLSGSEVITGTPGDAAKLVVTPIANAVAGTTQTVTVTAYDNFGNVAVDYAGTLMFSSSDTQASLPFYTFTAADHGTHSFSVTLRTAGTQTLTARDVYTPAITSTQSGVVITAAAATSITTSLAQSAVAGVAQPITVTAKDQFGNIASGYRGTVAFSSSDTLATLPANYTFTATDNGTHVFSVTFKSSTGQTLSVVDTVNAAMNTFQRDIQVSPAAMTGFSIKAPSNATAGTAFSITVIAVDAFGNTVTGYTGTVHFTGPSGGGNLLPADYKFTAADASKHTFSVTFASTGTLTLGVQDTLLGSLKGSTSIVVKTGSTSSGGGSGGGGSGGGGKKVV